MRKRPADSSDGLKVLRSVGRSLEIVDYHVLHARHAATETVADNDAERLRLFAAVMGALDEQHLHDDAMLVSQAHTVACMHATRNATDIFAQLVNLLLLDRLLSKIATYIELREKSERGRRVRPWRQHSTSFSICIGPNTSPLTRTPANTADLLIIRSVSPLKKEVSRE